MAEHLTPDEASLGQCVWAVVSAAMNNDTDAIDYLLTGLTAADLRILIGTTAGMIGSALTAAYGPEDARQRVAAKAVQFAAATDE